jgi:integrase
VTRRKEYKRTGATVNRYIATLSHLLSFAVKERRLIDRNPVGDISRKKEARGRTRFLSDVERGALLDACANSDWPALGTLVLLAITTGARRGELLSLRWSDVDLKARRALGALIRKIPLKAEIAFMARGGVGRNDGNEERAVVDFAPDLLIPRVPAP